MSTDPRIEPMAIAICASRHRYHNAKVDYWAVSGEYARSQYIDDATAALESIDKAATITTREQFDALPKSATILGKAGDAFQWGTDFDGVTEGWYMAGSSEPTPILDLMTFGPFTVIHRGTE